LIHLNLSLPFTNMTSDHCGQTQVLEKAKVLD
jgi:hypothetical protein